MAFQLLPQDHYQFRGLIATERGQLRLGYLNGSYGAISRHGR